jgi:hypothetical protein
MAAHTLTRAELDRLRADPRITPAHILTLEHKIQSGEWKIAEEVPA